MSIYLHIEIYIHNIKTNSSMYSLGDFIRTERVHLIKSYLLEFTGTVASIVLIEQN